jgi:Tfp pilus assembly protein PilO
MLVVVIAGWTLGISPILDQITAANTQTTTIQTGNAATQAQLANLRVQFAGIGKLRAKLNALRLSVPEAAAASAFLDEVAALAAQTGVTVQSVTIASAALYTAPAAADTTTTPADGTATPSPTPSATTPVGATPTTTAGGLVLVPVTVSVMGGFDATRDFAGALQTGSRLITVSSVGISTDDSAGGDVASITGNIFTLQGTSDVAATKKAPTTTPTSTATPTATATPTPTATATASSSTSKSGSTSAAPATVSTTPPVPVPTESSTTPSP